MEQKKIGQKFNRQIYQMLSKSVHQSNRPIISVGSGNGLLEFIAQNNPKNSNYSILCIDPQPNDDEWPIFVPPTFPTVLSMTDNDVHTHQGCIMWIIAPEPETRKHHPLLDYSIEAILVLRPRRILLTVDESGSMGPVSFFLFWNLPDTIDRDATCQRQK